MIISNTSRLSAVAIYSKKVRKTEFHISFCSIHISTWRWFYKTSLVYSISQKSNLMPPASKTSFIAPVYGLGNKFTETVLTRLLTKREKRMPNDHLKVSILNTCKSYITEKSNKRWAVSTVYTAFKQLIKLIEALKSLEKTHKLVYSTKAKDASTWKISYSTKRLLHTSSGNRWGYLENILSLKSLYLPRGTNQVLGSIEIPQQIA